MERANTIANIMITIEGIILIIIATRMQGIVLLACLTIETYLGTVFSQAENRRVIMNNLRIDHLAAATQSKIGVGEAPNLTHNRGTAEVVKHLHKIRPIVPEGIINLLEGEGVDQMTRGTLETVDKGGRMTPATQEDLTEIRIADGPQIHAYQETTMLCPETI